MLFSTKVERFLLYRCKASFTLPSSWDKIESLESKNYALNCPSSVPFSRGQINPVQTRLQLKLVIILPLFFDGNKIVPFQTLFQSLTFPTGRKFLVISSLNTLLTSPCPADPVPRLSASVVPSSTQGRPLFSCSLQSHCLFAIILLCDTNLLLPLFYCFIKANCHQTYFSAHPSRTWVTRTSPLIPKAQHLRHPSLSTLQMMRLHLPLPQLHHVASRAAKYSAGFQKTYRTRSAQSSAAIK